MNNQRQAALPEAVQEAIDRVRGTLVGVPYPHLLKAALDDISLLESELARLTEELEKQKLRADNHAETLRGIASMELTECERMKQWALDALSGYAESADATVKRLMDEVASERAAREQAERERDRWRHYAEMLDFDSCPPEKQKESCKHDVPCRHCRLAWARGEE